jgi:4-hydroxy 2-oxovalerate aldolase
VVTSVRLTDSTMRDGSHSIAHGFTVEQVGRIASWLDAAGVPVIEVAHGDGLGGSSFNYGFSATDELALIETAVQSVERAQVAVLLLPGIGLAHDLKVISDLGVRIVRVATHSTEADIAAQHIGLARELGLEVNGFLMMSHMTEPEELAEQAALMESYGAHGVYVVDSAGALVPSSVRPRIVALRERLASETAVGFHAHENMGCAVGNSLAAVEEGAELIDASIAGLGAGAGNMATERFAAAADRSGISTGIDVFAAAQAAEDVRELLGVQPSHTVASLALGYAGVYSSFLLHAERASREFDVPVLEILLELGRRGVVGGQEDMILDMAAELAGSPLPGNAPM